MLGLGIGGGLMNRAGQEYSAPNYSLSLDGAGDYVDLVPPTLFNINDTGDDHSISFWAKRTDNSDEAVVLGLSSTASFSRLSFDNDGNALKVEGDANGQEAEGVVTADTDWHHYVITIDGVTGDEATVVMYEDGSAITGGDFANTNFGADTSEGWTINIIGADSGHASNTNEFKGLLYQVAMWQEVLDADAVTAIYNSGTPIPLGENSGNYDNAGDLTHLWRFEEGSGTVAADTAVHPGTHRMPGTLVGNATFSTTTP